MAEVHATRAGWYPDPKMPGTMRYWDGAVWTDHAAPVPSQPDNRSGMSLALLVVGILIAAGVIWFVYSVAHSNDDLNCATENGDRALAGQPAKDCG